MSRGIITVENTWVLLMVPSRKILVDTGNLLCTLSIVVWYKECVGLIPYDKNLLAIFHCASSV
jgi:hypothetical protein